LIHGPPNPKAAEVAFRQLHQRVPIALCGCALEPSKHRLQVSAFAIKDGDIVGRYVAMPAPPSSLVTAHSQRLIDLHPDTDVEQVGEARETLHIAKGRAFFERSPRTLVVASLLGGITDTEQSFGVDHSRWMAWT
jgi:hypothetical protein